MLKFIFGVVLSTFVLSAYAVGPIQGGLKSAFDELNYELSVEWDQKDPAFFAEASTRFSSQIFKLKEQGLQNEEIMNFVLSEIAKKDPKKASELEKIYNLRHISALSSSEFEGIIKNIMSTSYSVGASWDSEATQALAISLIAFGMIITVLVLSMTAEDADPDLKCTVVCPNGRVGYCFQRDEDPNFCN